ncbi:phage tail collar domain-conataing protein [Nostoc sp. HK-01]|nr:phage tail collar domain-conataing protein [Nostoc sp. HK-01]
MTRPIYQNGDVLTAEAVNAIGYPIPDGQDFIGRGPKVVDSFLDDSPDQIKGRFYNFYDRLKVSHQSGLTFAYLSGLVLLSSGSIVTISASTINVPNNATSYIYVSSAGAVATAPSLPNESFPLALVTTASGTLSGAVADLRDKLVDRVQPSTVPSSIQTGMGMEWWGSTLPSGGWLWQDGTEYDIATYPALDAVLGAAFRTTAGKFRVPDRRGRVGVGAGTGTGLTARTVGQLIGAENHQLNVTEMPVHGHSTTESPHTHGTSQTPHTHTFIEAAHTHPLLVWDGTDGNASGGFADERVDSFISNAAIAGEVAATRSYRANNGAGVPIIQNISTGSSIAQGNANISLSATSTGITVNSQGGGAAHNNMQPSVVCNYIIKI